MLVVLCACSHGNDAPPTMRAIRARPSRYRIVYRVENRAGEHMQERWEELLVARPFRVRDATFDRRPTPTDTPHAGTLTSVDHLYTYRDDGLHEVSGRQPAVGTADQAIGPLLPEAVARGLAVPRKTRRTIAGRRCTEVRMLEPIAGPLKRLPATGPDHDDLCIDADGLVLREAWTLQGRLVQLREAVEVHVGDAVDAASTERSLDASGALPLGAGLAAPAVSPTAATPQATAPLAPDAFALATTVDFRFPDPRAPEQVAYSSRVWAFVRSADVITVESGTTPGGGAPPWSSRDITRQVAGLGETVVRSDGGELRRDLGGGRWVRVRGTVPIDELVTYARQRLRPFFEGGGG